MKRMICIKSFFMLCVLFIFSEALCAAPDSVSRPFGLCCGDVHSALKSGNDCYALFEEFVSRILKDRAKLTSRDWETVRALVGQYVQRCIRERQSQKGVEILRQLLTLPLPLTVKNEFYVLWHRLNPDGIPLRNLVEQFSYVDCEDSLQNRLLVDLYKMTLHSNYEDRKQRMLLAKEQGLYKEAYDQAQVLIQAVKNGECCPHFEVLDIEKCFLQKISLALQILNSEISEFYKSLLPSYYLAETAYANAVENLVSRIAKGEVSRSDEVDAVLLSHALRSFSVNRRKTIQELEVLIDGGKYLQSTLLYYGYFSLLDIYLQDKNLSSIERLLAAGEPIFISDHPYSPEYRYFLGAYFYARGDHSQAFDIFSQITEPATRLGITFAKTYEYLGCIAFRQKKYDLSEDFFLRAYKGWNREEAGMGLFLTFISQNKKEAREDLSKQMLFSSKNLQLLESLSASSAFQKNSSFEGASTSSSSSLEEVYSRCIYSMIKHKDPILGGPVLELIYDYLDSVEEDFLIKMQKVHSETCYWDALEFWKQRLKKKTKPSDSKPSKEKNIIELCYRALYDHDQEAIAALPSVFSEDCSSVQSALRLVWSLTRPKGIRNDNTLYCHGLPLRPQGDRLYLLTYDLQDYLDGHEKALANLSSFPDLFPKSSLLTLVYYLLGNSETSLFLKVAWFVKALAEFSEIHLFGENAKAWAYIYYGLKLNLADAYFSLGDIVRAVETLEEIKEDWYVKNHPRLLLLGNDPCRQSIELQWIKGLACGYMLLNEKNRLAHHLLEYVEKTILFSRSLRESQGESLAITAVLCPEACFK